MDLIITGANARFSLELRAFLSTLRSRGEFQGDVVVCDNQSKVRRWGPPRVDPRPTFSASQRAWIESFGARLVSFGELISEWGVDGSRLAAIHTGHACFPAKVVYSALLGREMGARYERIAFIDVDVFFQAPFDLSGMDAPALHMAGEGVAIGATKVMSTWMEDLRMPGSRQQAEYAARIRRCENLCGGFFAAPSATFQDALRLLWHLAEAPGYRFHNDQPLLNYLIWELGYPHRELPRSRIAHLAYADPARTHLDADRLQLRWNDGFPPLVHYHGPWGTSIRAALREHFGPPDAA